MIALLLVLGCTPVDPLPPAASGTPQTTLDQVGSGATIRLLDQLQQGDISLGTGNRPESASAPGRVLLDGKWKRRKGESSKSLWQIDSPIPAGQRRYADAPPGTALTVGTSTLRFAYPIGTGPDRAWSLAKHKVIVKSATPPHEWAAPPALVSSTVAALWDRLEPGKAGLPPEDFVDYELTIGIETRPGLLLPAPSSVQFTVDVPEGAVLETAVALTDLGLTSGPESDGAKLSVRVNGAEIDVAKARTEAFRSVRVDLSAYAGQTVELELASKVSGSADWDYVFVADPVIVGAPQDEVRRVIVVGIDTLRYDSVTQQGYERDTTAILDDFLDSSVIFDRAYAPAPRTRPSFRTATTGRYPFPAMDATSIGEVLSGQGFTTAGITANVHLVPRFGFNKGFDLWKFNNAEDADVQIGRAKQWLDANQDRDTFLFLHLMDPHNFYGAPWPYTNKYVEHEQGDMDHQLNRWQILAMRRLKDNEKAWLLDRYDGEVAYMARQLAHLLSWANALPGQTLIIVHSDHGEEFWEHDSYEHNHTLYDEVVRANLWMRVPGGWGDGPHRVSERVSIMDIAPTIYDLVGVPEEDWPEMDGVSLRALLDDADDAAIKAQLSERPLHVGYLMYDEERWAVITPRYKYILTTWDGREELYDLDKDPGEQDDVMDSAPGENIRQVQAELERATGWPTGPGLRVRLTRAERPFRLEFSGPVEGMILDPESGEKRRANIEWGIPSDHTPEDVGTLGASEDKRALDFQPGLRAKGTLAIRVDEVDEIRLVVGDESTTFSGDDGLVELGGVKLRIDPGTVILPQDSTAARMDAQGEGDGDQMEALRALGYIE